jgi:hypothetical protein
VYRFESAAETLHVVGGSRGLGVPDADMATAAVVVLNAV